MSYKVIVRQDDGVPRVGVTRVAWEPGCPLRPVALQVARETTSGLAYLQSRFKNVSAAVLGQVTIRFTVRYADGEAERLEIAPLDADVAPGALYEPAPISLTRGDAVAVETLILKASGPAGVWEHAAAPASLPQPPALSLPDEAMAERRAQLAEAGNSKAAERALADHDGWWQCPCGEINVGRDACCGCHMHHDKLRELEDTDILKAAAAERVQRERACAEEEKARQAAARTRNRRIAIAAAIALAVIAAIVAGSLIFNALQPRVRVLASVTTPLDSGPDTNAITFDEQGSIAGASETLGDKESSKITTDSNGVPVSATGTFGYTQRITKSDRYSQPLAITREYRWTTSISRPYKSTFELDYHGEGKLKSVRRRDFYHAKSKNTTPKNETVTTSYTPEGFMSRRVAEDSSATRETTYTYEKDSSGRVFQYTAIYTYERGTSASKRGSSTSGSDSTTSYTLTYDKDGNIKDRQYREEAQKGSDRKTTFTYTEITNPTPWTRVLSHLKMTLDPLDS